MPFPLLGALFGGAVSAIGASSAANTQRKAAQDAAEAQLTATRETNDMLKGFRQEDVERFQPFYDGGLDAYNALRFENGLGDRPEGYQGFTGTPGYDFRRQQGLDAVQGSVAGRQGLMSGAALKAMERFGQDYASNEYGNYLSRLGGMASGGQSAAGLQASTSQNYGAQIGNNMLAGGQAQAQGFMNAGNAAAAGTVGMTNAFNNALGQGMGLWQQNKMLDAFGAR